MRFVPFITRRLETGQSDTFTGIIIRFAIGTIALCLTVILLAHALILGFKEEIKAKVFGFWGHIQISAYNLNNTFESPPISADQTFYPSLDTVGAIPYISVDPMGKIKESRTKGGVRHIQVFGLKPGILARKNNLEGILLKGVGKDFDWEFLSRYLEEGRPLQPVDTLGAREILISRTTANRMDMSLNEDLIIHFIQQDRQVERKFKVTGIYKTGLEEYDRKFALVDMHHLQELAGWSPDTVSGFEVFLDHLEDADAFSDYIYYEIPLPTHLYVETIRQKFPAIFDWVEIQDINENVLLILMLLVVMINLSTVLLILILERYNMVGILKAIGASNWAIRLIFIRLTLRILIWGLVIGNGLALLLGSIQRQTGWFTLDEKEYYLSQVPIHWDLPFFLFINGFVIAVAILCLLIPSLYIKRISPVDAIRFK